MLFRSAQARWRKALDAHRLAPPDVGFSARLAALSKAASAEAEACREAEAARFEWPPHRAASSQPPYELRPDSGRRGPDELWRRFDARFYLARLPAGQSVHPQPDEVTDWLWAHPQEALAKPDITLVYATRAVLESVADARDVNALFARARRLKDIPVVEPLIVATATGWEIVRA